MSKQLEYHVDRRDSVMLIQPVGRVDSSQIARFEEVVMSQVQTGRHDVVLDFEQLTFLSSSALRILLGAARQAKKRNNAFLLCALKPHITDLMKTAGFDRLLHIHATTEEAIRQVAEMHGRTREAVADGSGHADDPGQPGAADPAADRQEQGRRHQRETTPDGDAGARSANLKRRVRIWRWVREGLARVILPRRSRTVAPGSPQRNG